MAIQTTVPQPTALSLGARVNTFPKAQQAVIVDIIDTLNDAINGSISTTDLTLSDDLVVGDDATITGDLVAGTITTAGASALNGAITQSLTTDSTTKDTGAIVTEGGIGVEKAIFAGTTINAGTSVNATTSISFGTVSIEGNNTGITAFAGGGQGSATALTRSFNEITTCATAGDSVKLPAAVAGTRVTIKNDGATAADIFPASDDSINALAVNTAIRIAPNATKTFRAVDGTVWEEESEIVAVTDGAVGTPSHTFNTQPDMGLYKVSSTQLGVSVGGALKGGFDSNGVFTDTINEQTSTIGVTIDGALIKDGAFTGKQATATATADGLTTGLLSGADQFVTVTSANANNIICLPSDATCPIGTVIRGWVDANGFELRSLAADTTQTINNVTCGTTNEAAIPATTRFKVEKVASLTWLLTAVDELGAVITAIIPDAV